MASKAERTGAGKRKDARPARGGKAALNLGKLRNDYGLSCRVLARALGVTEATLHDWEKGAGSPTAHERGKVRKFERLFRKAAGAMRRSYLPTWLVTPSEACAELGAATPLALLEKGDYEAVEDLLYYLGSGVSF
jgi:DNA-binding XRE family transcriptional regulator